MVTLETVEVPGLREAIQRESHVRDTSFLEGKELVCGVVVRPLCLETIIWLEQAKNGFFVRCIFEDDRERLAHALQALYFCRPQFQLPDSPVIGFWKSFRDGWAEQMFIRKVSRSMSRDALVVGVKLWVDEAFMDAPSGDVGLKGPSYASFPVYIVDRFAEAGLPFTYREIMGMPLKRLWQYLRISNRRIRGEALSNPSDQIAVDYIAKVKA